jgi:predicted ATPase/DNA-binding CsgD family transcriptional regulator
VVVANFPSQPTPFVGRENELADIARLLADPACRLLTLVGPGGIGKTRLATQAARAHDERFANDVYLIFLQSLNTPDFIIPTIAEALHFQFYPGGEPNQQLFGYLREKSALLVLDNFEHLLDGAGLVSDLLSGSSDVKVLATSRERLNLVEEWVMEIDGLPVPTSEAESDIARYGAVQLFSQMAKRTHTGFTLGEAQKPAVTRICRLVGGMPLGIELAAAWVRALSCDEIADEIERGLDILESAARNVLPRHRNMRAALEHSWNLLTDTERNVFKKLSVFRGGFRKEAVQVVADASLSTLSALVDKSLLRVDTIGRYEIHELLRQYGEEMLADAPLERDETRDRHARYFMDFANQAYHMFFDDLDQQAAFAVSVEIANLEAGARRTLHQGMARDLSKCSGMMAYYYQIRGLLHFGESTFRIWAESLRAEPVEAERNQALGGVLTFLAWMIHLQTRNEEALLVLEESLSLLDRTRSQSDFAVALAYLGRVNRTLGRFQQAQAYLLQALAIFRVQESKNGKFMSFGILGETALDLREYDEAQRYLEACLAECDRPAKYARQYPLSLLALAHMGKGETVKAKDYLLQAIPEIRSSPDVLPIFFMLAGIVLYLKAQRRDEEAAEVLMMIAEHPFGDAETREKMRPHLAEVRNRLTLEAFSRAEQRAADALRMSQRSGSGSILAPAYFDQLTHWLESPPTNTPIQQAPPDSLTPRELEILRLIADGLSNQDIADRLTFALGTVKWYTSQIYSKLGVQNRTQAVIHAQNSNLLS